MEQRISIVTLGVRNLQISTDFYKALGWQTATPDGGSIVFFNLQSMALSLYQLDKLSEDVEVNLVNDSHPPFTLAYNTRSEEEVDDLLKEAKTRGAKIIKNATKVFWGGYSGYFSDPDGFLWEVAYNPFAKLDPSGAFQSE